MSLAHAALVRVQLAGAWSHDRGRLLLTTIAIALGVALATLVHLVNHSAAVEFDAAVRALSGDADVQVTGPRSGFDETVYARLARREEVAIASPVLEMEARLAGSGDSLRIQGLDPFRALELQPGLLGDAARHVIDLLQPGTIMLTETAAHRFGVVSGDSVAVQVGLRTVELKVVAIVPAGALRQPVGIMDIGSAQWAFERLGWITRIDLRLRPGFATPSALAGIEGDLPAGVQALNAEQANERGLGASRAYRVNLEMLARIALVTSAVLVFATQTLSMLRRRTQFGLLRALGVSAPALAMLLTTEAAAIGIAGSLAGLVLGTLGAYLAILHAGSDLGAGFFAGLVVYPTIHWSGLAAIGATGLGASLLGGLIPALDAARAEPARCLRAGDEERTTASIRSPVPGVAILATGALLATLPSIDGLPAFGYASVAALLLGTLMLTPHVVPRLLPPPTPRSALLWLDLQQLRGSPRTASLGLSGIVASFSLVVAMTVMIHSFRTSLDDWLEDVLPADLYARSAGGGSGWLDAEAQQRLKDVQGVARILFSRHDTLLLHPDRPPVTLIARDIRDAAPEALPLVSPQVPLPEGAVPAWISEAVRDVHGYAPGDAVRLPIRGRMVEFHVAGVWRDYVRQTGAIVVPRAAYLEASGDPLVNEAWIWLQGGADPDEAAAAMRASLRAGDEIEIREPGRIRALSLEAFDRTFAVTYALQLAALVIGLFGISVGTSAQLLARRRQLGVLRHMGLDMRDLRRMAAIEGALLGSLGALIGIASGLAMSLVLVHVVNRQSFHWSMDLHVPWSALAGLIPVLACCAAATAALSVRGALGPDTVRAVKEDW